MEQMIDTKHKVVNFLRLLKARQLYVQLRALIAMTILLTVASTSHAEIPAVESDVSYTDAMFVVKELHQKLMYIMQNAGPLGYHGRYDEVQGVVTSRFDTPLIVKVIMSRYWKKMDDVQKADFINLFKRLSVATYASRFDDYSGESFVELSTEKLRKGRLLIKTELQRPDDEPVKLDYLMHENDGQWMIISVIANGVNDLSLKRAEYATVIKNKGFQGLVVDVAGKIADMEDQDEE